MWLGLLSGIIVFIISLTGCVYVFSEDIKSICYKDRQSIDVVENSNRIGLDELVKTAEAEFDNKYAFKNLVVPNYPDQTVSVIFEEYDEDAFGYPNYVTFSKTIYLNPYTGKIVHIENTKWEFFNIVFWIHITLFMGYNSVSHWVVLLSVLSFVILLISGLILWMPRTRQQRKQSFSFKWKTSTRWRRKNFDLHRILGFYTFIFALLMALTGLIWVSDSFNSSVKWIANGGEVIEEEELPEIAEKAISKTPFEDILTSTLAQIPETKYVLIRKHPIEAIPYIVRSYIDETVNYKRIEMYYDRQSASLISQEEFGDKNNGEKVQALNYDLHVGSIGGWPTKILAFLVSLVIASLPISGFMIWLGRKKKNKIKNKT